MKLCNNLLRQRLAKSRQVVWDHIHCHWQSQFPSTKHFPSAIFSNEKTPTIKQNQQKAASQLDIHCLHLPSRCVCDLPPRSRSQSRLSWSPGMWPHFQLYHIPQHPRNNRKALIILRAQHKRLKSAMATPGAQTQRHCGHCHSTNISLLKHTWHWAGACSHQEGAAAVHRTFHKLLKKQITSIPSTEKVTMCDLSRPRSLFLQLHNPGLTQAGTWPIKKQKFHKEEL